ncbi:MAG: Mrp/NBP35 family ATP-binding protein [Actinobacteria bacterium]|nr:Mrp/NBP35 family ATP-binding protein [Actinomycetota bacterium]
MGIVGNDENKQLSDEVGKNIAGIKHKFIVMSGKGGVGKTTVSVSLAYSLALRGHGVGLLDVDIHGPNVNKMLGLENKPLTTTGTKINPIKVFDNMEVVSTASIIEDPDTPIIWRGPLKMKLIKQFLGEVNWGPLDYLIIDSPPGTGDEPLSVVQLISDLDGAIIVTTPQEVALLDARKSIQFAKKLNVPFIGLVENMSGLICPHCGKKIDLFGEGTARETAEKMNVVYLGEIPMDPEVIKLCDSGKLFESLDKESAAAKNIMKLAEVIEKYSDSQKKAL